MTELTGTLVAVCSANVPKTVCTCIWFLATMAATTPSMVAPRARAATSDDGVTSVAAFEPPPDGGGVGGGGGKIVVITLSIS